MKTALFEGQPVIVHNPGNTFKITELYAYVSADEGGEGIIGAPIQGVMTPLIGADLDRMKSLRPVAKALAKQFGVKIKFMRFTLESATEVKFD